MINPMKSVELAYGKKRLPFDYDPDRFSIIGENDRAKPLSDLELGQAFDAPVDSERIEDLISPGESVLIAVPDATRDVGAGQVLNLLVRRLIANGTLPYDISIIFATGTHRAVTADERIEILTPFIADRIRSYVHRADDPINLYRIGTTPGGIDVKLNWRVSETDHLILIGGIGFHYFAGFTGGRKLVCPGLAASETVTATHSLAFDPEIGDRAQGSAPGVLGGNPVHEAFVEAVKLAEPSFCFNTITNEDGEITNLICGHWESSHSRACKEFYDRHTVPIDEKKDLVVVSAGGHPHDINLIQAHKAFEMASYACREGGRILLIAECPDGYGSDDFMNWVTLGDSDKIADRLAGEYVVGGQTAWSLRRKTERFEVSMLTDLDRDVVSGLGIERVDDLTKATAGKSGYIMPFGASFLPVIK